MSDSDDERDGSDVEPPAGNNAAGRMKKKYLVIATGRVPYKARVQENDNTLVQLVPPNLAQNTVTSPSWLQDIPLPRVLAQRVNANDAVAWEALASRVYTQGGMSGWGRDANCDLNSGPDEEAKFRWDVKLSRKLPPSPAQGTDNTTRSKYKKAKQVLDSVWDALQERVATMPAEARQIFENYDEWSSASVDELATAFLSACRGAGAGAFAAPAAPVPAASNLDRVRQDFLFVTRRSSQCTEMMWSDAVVRALAQGTPLPTTASWLAPRWSQFPILIDSRDLLRMQGTGEYIGERFTFNFFKSASAANAYQEDDEEYGGGGADYGGMSSEGEEEEEEEKQQEAPAAPAEPLATETSLNAIVQSTFAAARAEVGVLSAVSAITRVAQEYFPELNLDMCDNRNAALRTSQSYWEFSPMTHLMQKKGMFALTFDNVDGAQVGFALVSPLDVDVSLLTMLPTSFSIQSMSAFDKRKLYRALSSVMQLPSQDRLVQELKTKLLERLSSYNAGDLDQATQAFVRAKRDTIAMQLTFTAASSSDRDVFVAGALNEAWKKSPSSSIAMVPVLCAARERRAAEPYLSAVFLFVNKLLKKLEYVYMLVPEDVKNRLNPPVTFTKVVLQGKKFDITNNGQEIVSKRDVVNLGTYYAHSV